MLRLVVLRCFTCGSGWVRLGHDDTFDVTGLGVVMTTARWDGQLSISLVFGLTVVKQTIARDEMTRKRPKNKGK